MDTKIGNMTSDLNRGIVNIVYNSLNLPVRIEMADGSLLESEYTADGALLSRTACYPSDAQGLEQLDLPVDAEGCYVCRRTYSGGREYVNGELDRIAM